MSVFNFGSGPDHLSAAADKAARKHGHNCAVVNYTEPSGEKRHWFEADNRGEPFDQQLAREVLQNPAIIKAKRAASARASAHK